MGRDALGHGHNEGEPGNPFHGKGGEFSSGGGSSGGGGHTSAGARVAFAERAKLKAQAAKAKPVAHVKADKATKTAAAKGDHQRAQSHSGRGYPVAPHMGAHSVGTHQARGGGGGGGSGGGRAGASVRLTKNAKERVAIGKATDARHYPGEPAAQTIQFGRAENVPTSKQNIGRRPPGRLH